MKKEFKVISELIDNKSKVLDVGCGDGDLMKYLFENKTKDIRGLEISKKSVQNCLSKGLPVIEGNAENDLMQFPNHSFEYLILSQTLQAFLNPEQVIKELLRVGKKAIVTIPNFGHWKVRLKLLINGTMPLTENLPYEWHNTPNLHMCTIKDFFIFCKKRDIKILKSLALNQEKISEISVKNLKYKNLMSDLGIFLIGN
ncbi:MAG: methionine biosynthesis protein MetW [Candidatus Pelagibacter sp.]